MGSRDTWVAGLNHGAHDSSCALLRNGTLIAAADQERYSRTKRAIDQPPVDALKYCLDHAGLRLENLDAVALGSDLDALGQWLGMPADERRRELPLDDPRRLFPPTVFGHGPRPPLVPVRHHVAHAASAFWPSGFEEAAILVMDNRGEDSATTLAHGSAKGIEVLESYPIEHSLGLYYRIATQYTGLYSKSGNAGKLMGLAAYGRPTYDVALRYGSGGPEWVGVPQPTTTGRDLPPQRTAQLLRYFEEHCYPYTPGLKDDITAYVDFAASAQTALEETILELARDLRQRTDTPNLALAGGVALNCSANGRLASEGLFERIFIQPWAHDGGVALGAALEVARQLDPEGFEPQTMAHAYWGPAFTDDEIRRQLDAHAVTVDQLSPHQMAERVAHLIASGHLVGWFQGRSEIGPRALGARSLLGDPRQRETLVRLNRLKGREMWRPLAPSVPEDSFDKYFAGSPSPFMIQASRVRHEFRPLIPAVVHIDGSARPQVVDPDTNPLFARTLKAFETETGIPILVNTSFNTADVPIVNTPHEAISTFLHTELDALAIGSFLAAR